MSTFVHSSAFLLTILVSLLHHTCTGAELTQSETSQPKSDGAEEGAGGADDLEKSYGQYQARSPLMYRVATNYGNADFRNNEMESPLNSVLLEVEDSNRGSRHFSTLDACSNSVCDYVLRQAHSLARIKLLREYIKDTVGMLDRLVTAVDSQLVTAGDTLARSVGNSCRAVRPVLTDVTKSNVNADRSRGEALRSWYPIKK
ncbi:hypothetical protein FHG87_016983 [Trinorchestia longiramus]|nr:hypothetical protein FHG87_016983 [Trinorchestia longiramus]